MNPHHMIFFTILSSLLLLFWGHFSCCISLSSPTRQLYKCFQYYVVIDNGIKSTKTSQKLWKQIDQVQWIIEIQTAWEISIPCPKLIEFVIWHIIIETWAQLMRLSIRLDECISFLYIKKDFRRKLTMLKNIIKLSLIFFKNFICPDKIGVYENSADFII